MSVSCSCPNFTSTQSFQAQKFKSLVDDKNSIVVLECAQKCSSTCDALKLSPEIKKQCVDAVREAAFLCSTNIVYNYMLMGDTYLDNPASWADQASATVIDVKALLVDRLVFFQLEKLDLGLTQLEKSLVSQSVLSPFTIVINEYLYALGRTTNVIVQDEPRCIQFLTERTRIFYELVLTREGISSDVLNNIKPLQRYTSFSNIQWDAILDSISNVTRSVGLLAVKAYCDIGDILELNDVEWEALIQGFIQLGANATFAQVLQKINDKFAFSDTKNVRVIQAGAQTPMADTYDKLLAESLLISKSKGYIDGKEKDGSKIDLSRCI